MDVWQGWGGGGGLGQEEGRCPREQSRRHVACCCFQTAQGCSPPPGSSFSRSLWTSISLALTSERSKGVGSRTLAEDTGRCFLSGQSRWSGNRDGGARLTRDAHGLSLRGTQEGAFRSGEKGNLECERHLGVSLKTQAGDYGRDRWGGLPVSPMSKVSLGKIIHSFAN